MAERPRDSTSSLLFQCGIALLCTVLGVYCSNLLFGPPKPLSRLHEQPPMSCDEVAASAALPSHVSSFLGTKLPYQFVGVVRNETTLRNCTAEKLYGVIRHGVRYPSKSYLTKWPELIKKLRNGPVKTSLGAELVGWRSEFEPSLAAQVTPYGLREQYCLARRFMTRYPVLLGESYTESYYSFLSTSLARTIQSGLAFARGLFEGTGPIWGYQPIYLQTVDKDRDLLLRFFDVPCSRYDQAVTNNQSLHNMLASYLVTDEVTKIVEKIREVFSSNWLSVDDVKSLFKLCVQELSLSGKSKWCDLFSSDDLLTLSYYSDMRAYWVKGPGFTVTGQRSVQLLQDIVSFLSDNKSQKVAWRFAHAETLLPLQSLMGVVQSKPHLLSNNYKELLKSRSFQTSKLTPFSGNLVMVKYSCEGGGDYVRVLLNEEPIRLQICNQNELCKLREFVDVSRKLTNHWRTMQETCS